MILHSRIDSIWKTPITPARLAGRSLSSFRRDFISTYNMPPSRWIRIKRLEKSRELLSNTTMTVTDICYTLGFESVAHYSRIFKLHYGYPPSEIRLKSYQT
ncbi:MAG: helix-turn-helix transcriptional regulator [Bacteroidia bacterium]|nr:helix-turn-helix transcriptional regulator [Bacteroidota bacterium]MBK7572037.1 helix-turn-helix transcriptional regulator [Bacteroidota bacterium]MBK8587059.1 helix-turn-helix transcriptional regulator [Bacteroidota bacterium]MBP9922620.1 helix-turn-helix transcriptional regulator [Bacteroidia bacterium]